MTQPHIIAIGPNGERRAMRTNTFNRMRRQGWVRVVEEADAGPTRGGDPAPITQWWRKDGRTRVVHVIPWDLTIGGIQTMVSEWCGRHGGRFDVHVVSPGARGTMPFTGAVVHAGKTAFDAKGLLSQLEPDVLVHHGPTAGYGQYTGCPVVWVAHATSVFQGTMPTWVKPVAILSNYPPDPADCGHGWDAAAVTAIPLGVDLDAFRPRRLVAAICGRLSVDKVPWSFVEALAAWDNPHGWEVWFIGAGADNPYQPRVKARLESIPWVRFIDDVPHADMPDWLNRIDAVLAPSLLESGSYAIVEAMACGLPVVARDVGGVSFNTGGAAWLVKEDREFLDALDRLSDSGERASWGGMARAEATARHSISDHTAAHNRAFFLAHWGAEALPPVSVIMAVHNTRPDWLRAAVESVLFQTAQPAELILVDDGSTNPETVAEIDRLSPRCRLLRLDKNIGAGPARNEALKVATSDLIGIMDSDDIAMPHWLETMLAYLRKRPDADIVSPLVDFMDGRKLPTLSAIMTFDDHRIDPWFTCHPGMVYRRDDALQAGGYGDTSTGSDLMLWRRMMSRGAVIHNIAEKLIRYRTHPGQLTSSGDVVGRNLQAVLDAPLVRRRRVLVGSYFLPDPGSAGGGPNIYIDEVKYLEKRDDLIVKWVYALPGEMAQDDFVSDEGRELRRRWKCERVGLGDTKGLACVISLFKPDFAFPLGWHLAGDIQGAQALAKSKFPIYTRAEHVNFISGEMSIDNAQNELTKAQHAWQISVKARELAAYQGSTAALCVSEDDADCVKKNTAGVPVYFVPPVTPIEKRQYNPDTASKDVVFLGGTWHRGNLDALIYLMRDVWPHVKAASPESKVKVCGVCGDGLGQWVEAKKIIDQYPGDIEVLGFVSDLGDVFEDIACSVVPVITGGGVKIKLQTAFSFGCPSITTPWVADEFKLGPEFDDMIGVDAEDYARKVVALIERPELRIEMKDIIDQFNVTWGAEARNAVIDRAIPGAPKRIISAANCLTLSIADRSTHLFQARSDTLARMLAGEENTADYNELLPYFKPNMVTPIPRTLPPACDIFLWSNMVDETTWAIDFHGWPFGPNHAYDAALRPEMVEAFWDKYLNIDKPTLDERAANYRAVNASLVAANPAVRRIVLLYDTSRFHATKPDAARSYDESAEHMVSVLQPLGWEVHRVPTGQAARKTDNHWAHYDEQWTREWLLDILEGKNAVQQ